MRSGASARVGNRASHAPTEPGVRGMAGLSLAALGVVCWSLVVVVVVIKYVVFGRETLVVTGARGMARWRKALFAYMSRNTGPANAFFHIPANRVVELGTRIEI